MQELKSAFTSVKDIQYDSIKKEVIIFCRGKRIILSGPYTTEAEGRRAAEEYLRQIEE